MMWKSATGASVDDQEALMSSADREVVPSTMMTSATMPTMESAGSTAPTARPAHALTTTPATSGASTCLAVLAARPPASTATTPDR